MAMRIVSAGFAVVITTALLFTQAFPVAAEDDVSFIGGGFGHGVGMSQYGARGMAEEGASADEIIQHYYSGTTVGQVATVTSGDEWLLDGDGVWVGLVEDTSSVTFHPLAAAEICVHGYIVECQVQLPVAADETVVVADAGTGCTVTVADTQVYGPGSCAYTVETGADYIEVDSMPLRSGNPRRYHDGALEIRPVGIAPADDTARIAWILNGPFHVAWATSLSNYTEGIDEMPLGWPTAALQAQAIAARSFATSRALGRETGSRSTTFLNDPALTSSRADSCWCHLDDGTSDQVYEGWPQDADATWLAATAATEGEVAVYDGSIATGFYSSSTSGVTESMETGFGGSFVPYLVSVDDHWSEDPINPWASWTLKVDSDTLADALGWDSVSAVALDRVPPGAEVTVAGTDGGVEIVTEVTGRSLRSKFSAIGVTQRSPGIEDVVSPEPPLVGLSGDFTGNGADELATYNSDTGNWKVTTASSHATWGTFGTKTGWEFVPGDFNGDGNDDIAAYHEGTGRWWIVRSTGTAFTFELWTTFGTKTGWEFVPGDFNGDGNDDIAAYHEGTGRWWIVRSTGTAFTFELWTTFGTKTGWEFVPGDFNGDGNDDIAAYHEGTGRWWIVRSTGTAFTLELWATFVTKTGWEFVPGDFNGDGNDDIAAYHEGTGRWWIVRSTGTAFTLELWATFVTKTGWEFVPGDFNGDGNDDIAAYHEGTGRWWIVRSTGTAFTFELWATYENQFDWTLLGGDHTGDGNDDVLGARVGFAQVVLAKSTGSAFDEVIWR